MAHKNSTGYWEHQGTYSVVLTDNADTSRLPEGILLQKRTISVENGRIKQTMGGIQFYVNEQPFCWSYSFIKEIRNSNGKLIWQNRDYE